MICFSLYIVLVKRSFVIPILGFLFIWPSHLFAQQNDDGLPLKIGVFNIIDVMSNLRGGIKQETALLYNLDVIAEFDTSYIGIDGGALFFYGIINNHKELQPIVGDFQVSSNIDNSEVYRLFELWYAQNFANDKGSIKVGLFDLNSEFDVIEPAELFLNSSHGIGPDFSQTGLNGPSIFPSTSLAVRLQYQINDILLLRGVMLDAVPNDPNFPRRHKISLNEGMLLVGEMDFSFVENWRFLIGLWHYTSRFSPIDKDLHGKIGGNTGIYGSAAGDLSENISIWLRLGIANQNINQLSHYMGTGIVYKGLIPNRPHDTIGFAIAAAGNGNPYKNFSARNFMPMDDYEIAYELTYRFEATSWLSLQPDIQYIKNPGMNPAVKDVLVVGMRIEIGAEF